MCGDRNGAFKTCDDSILAINESRTIEVYAVDKDGKSTLLGEYTFTIIHSGDGPDTPVTVPTPSPPTPPSPTPPTPPTPSPPTPSTPTTPSPPSRGGKCGVPEFYGGDWTDGPEYPIKMGEGQGTHLGDGILLGVSGFTNGVKQASKQVFTFDTKKSNAKWVEQDELQSYLKSGITHGANVVIDGRYYQCGGVRHYCLCFS